MPAGRGYALRWPTPLLLGILGLAAGWRWFARVADSPRAPDSGAAVPCERPESPLLACAGARRMPVRGAPASDVLLRSCQPRADPAEARSSGTRGERDYLAEFTALASAGAGVLELRAEEVFGGDGPLAEKASMLRALRASASPQSLAWHEHAARASSADLASAALAAILRDAGHDGAARSVLARLAFESPALAPALRRRAAAGFARHSDEAGLVGLGFELARQTDALLVDGALAALAEREPSAGRTRLLLAHGRSDEPVVTAPE